MAVKSKPPTLAPAKRKPNRELSFELAAAQVYVLLMFQEDMTFGYLGGALVPPANSASRYPADLALKIRQQFVDSFLFRFG